MNHPGRYAGGSVDSVLSFVDRAGGIDPARGSYRHIEIIRGGKSIAKLDLYLFALQGKVPQLRLKNGDVILVNEKGVSVSAYGLLREEAQYEFSKPAAAKGSGLIELASPLKNVSHVSVTGTRNKAPFNKYFTVEAFKDFKLADGDIVEFVADKPGETIMATVTGAITGAYGLLREEAQYEFSKPAAAKGSGLIELASPLKNVSHVSVTGTRNKAPFNKYFTVEAFKDFKLADGDIVEFVADKPGETIMATVTGAITGASRYPVKKTVKLRDLLRQVEVEPELAATDAVYLRRKSVARDQKAVIQDSLHRLEKAALTATSATPEEATVRVEEAKLIQDFVKRASLLEPDGVIVVSRGGQVNDIWLEDGDEIVIPQKSNVVQITGEVVMPKSIAFEEGMSLDDYLAAAGGVSDRGDEKHILVAKQNGEVGLAEHLGINAGDRILVLPKVDVKSMLLAKDLMTIVYQIAVATKVAVDL